MYDKEVLEIFDRLKIFKALYEVIRFVDPVKKKVLTYDKGILNTVDSNCFDNWNKNMLCKNCTSMRAYNENKTFMKMEHNKGDVYMVTSIPLKLADRNLVIELLKDASLSMGFNDCDIDSQSDIYKTIDSMNEILLKDSLTGAYNRRYIDEILPVDIAMSSVLDKNYAVIMADLDFFKTVNDTYGHLAGDVVLKKFTELLGQHIISENNWIARYGGEEFLIGVHDCTKEEVVDLAKQIRLAVEDKVFFYEDNKIKITASFGVATTRDVKDSSKCDTLIDYADKKLYEAKNNGRNRVEF